MKGRGSSSGAQRRPLLLALAGLALVLFFVFGPRGGGEPAADDRTPRDAELDAPPDDAYAGGAGGRRILDPAEACRDAGYLCADGGGIDLVRWPERSTVLTVRVPLPPDEPPEVALGLQRAAVQGLLAWQGHPLGLVILDRAGGGDADIEVEWVRTLPDGRLGEVGMRWQELDGVVVRLEISRFLLATRVPSDPARPLSPRQVELIAAHEMGHALGLPHSDSPADVMFPQNSATHLTTRDYRTMEALYSLPNGARIPPYPDRPR
jgi:hypothetical protein